MCNMNMKHICVPSVAMGKQLVLHILFFYSQNYPTGKVDVSYDIVIYGLSNCIIFFHSVSVLGKRYLS